MGRQENTEQEILRAAEQEFIEKGFSGAKTTAIAQRAGVNHAMIHYYFRTKENLFNRLFEEKIKILTANLYPAFFNKNIPLIERLKKGIASHFDFIAENPGLPRLVVNEIISNPARREFFRNKIKIAITMLCGEMQTELDRLAKDKQICPIKAEDLLLDVVSLNLTIFIIHPLIEGILYSDHKKFIEQRKQENINIILSRLNYRL